MGIHSKLKAIGMTEERLEKLGVGAILHQPCPDCGSDIFYTLQGEYYSDWKKGDSVCILLRCNGCNSFKPRLEPEKGEVLYEREGDITPRKNIPLIERVSDLP